MNAYSRLYLEKTQVSLGCMLHYAVYELGLDAGWFYRMFLNSGIAHAFGIGEPKYTVGMSGIELAQEVIRASTGKYPDTKTAGIFDRTPEFWAGWAVAYYEWCTATPFERIEQLVPITEIIEMYNPYHEADVTRFADSLDSMILRRQTDSRLARLRDYANLSQKALAERSGVSVRMIEQYEQGRKDIDHASAATVYNLSRALNCRMEDLIH